MSTVFGNASDDLDVLTEAQMRIMLGAALAVMATGLELQSQIVLTSGEALTHHFASLAPLTIGQNGTPNGHANFNLSTTNLLPGSTLLFEMFEGAAGASAPMLSRVLDSNSIPRSDFQASVVGAWQDREGSIRLTMLSGSATIDRINFGAYLPGEGGGYQLWEGTLVPGRPALSVSLSGSAVSLQWPASADNFVLEVCSSLAPTAWQPVTNTVARSGSEFILTLEPTEGEQFFRLRLP